MNYLALIIFLLSVAVPPPTQAQAGESTKDNKGGGAILYSEGGAFMVAGPQGWILDRVVGERLGTCCVFYPKDTNWDDAETVMYPSIATKRPGQQTLEQFMASDLDDFRDHNPGMSFEDGSALPLKNGRSAKIRYFYNVNKGSSEAVVYIDEEKIIALVVMSSKSKKGLNDNLSFLKSTLTTYAFMDVRFANSAKNSNQPTSK